MANFAIECAKSAKKQTWLLMNFAGIKPRIRNHGPQSATFAITDDFMPDESGTAKAQTLIKQLAKPFFFLAVHCDWRTVAKVTMFPLA